MVEICAYCREAEADTSDHVFARSWYPTTTPEHIEKWQVPACQRCNNKKSRLESEVRNWLVATVSPHSPAAKGIFDSTLRALKEEYGKDAKDKEARERARLKFVGSLGRIEDLSDEERRGITQTPIDPRSRITIRPDMARVEALMKLFVLGCFRYIKGRPLYRDGLLRLLCSHNVGELLEFTKIIAASDDVRTIGPGFRVAFLEDRLDDAMGYTLAITIWGEFHINAAPMEPLPDHAILGRPWPPTWAKVA